MNRWIKIALVSLASLVGVILLTVGIAVWIVFTPARLTPLIQKYLNSNFPCEISVGKADLTFFSTFPRFSIHLEDALVKNHFEGASSDTVACVTDLYAAVDVRRYLKKNEIAVDEIALDRLSASLFLDSSGRSNIDIFLGEKDTTENEDTSAFSLPCELIDVRKISLTEANLEYRDIKDGMSAKVSNMAADVTAKINGSSKSAVSFASMLDISYSDSTGLETSISRLAASLDAETEHFTLPWNPAGYAGNLKLSADTLSLTIPGKEPLAINGTAIILNLNDIRIGSDSSDASISISLPHLWARMGDCSYARDCSVSLESTIAAGMRLDSLKLQDVSIKDGRFALNQFAAALSGRCTFPEEGVTDLSAALSTNGLWRISDVMALVPEQFLRNLDGIVFDGYAGLKATASGKLSEKSLPNLKAAVTFRNGSASLADIPYDLKDVEIDADAMVDLNRGPRIDADIRKVSARTENSSVKLSGQVRDVLGKMSCDLKADAGVSLSDLKPVIPDSLGVTVDGNAAVSVKTAFLLDDVLDKRLDKMKFSAGITFDTLNASYADTIKLKTPKAELKVNTDAGTKEGCLKARTRFSFNSLALSAGDGMAFAADSLVLKVAGEDNGDTTSNMVDRWNPFIDMNFKDGVLDMSILGERIGIPSIDFNYHDDVLKIRQSGVRIGRSDFALSGVASNIWNYVNDKGSLIADLDFVSDTADVEHLLSLVSGIGSDDAGKSAGAVNENASPDEPAPFMVPLGMDVTLRTRISNAMVSKGTFDNVNGTLFVKDGTAVVEQMGFTSKAARMQLTALYRSPRKDHLFVGLDFHLLDIDIEQLINLIPAVDTIVPMLKSFKGQAEFHIAGETNLWGDYSLKISTLRVASAIEGKNLVVLDSDTFDTIAKYLMFKKKTQNIIDSMSVEMTVFRDEVDVYPFLISMDKYNVVAGGRHNLDNSFFYNLEVLSPVRLGLDITGTFDDMKFKLAPCQYKTLFKPEKRSETDQQVLKLKKLISDALKSKVKEETRNAERQ